MIDLPIIDALLRLLDKSIDLVEQREKQRADFFKNFAEPVRKDFEAVHQNYLDTFRKYADLVSNSTLPLDHQHPVFRAVELDSLFSDAMRGKLADANRLASNNTQLHQFIRCIVSYLEAVPEASSAYAGVHLADRDPSWALPMCLPRIGLKNELHYVAERSDITQVDRQALALMCVSAAAQCLQDAHVRVHRSFSALKGELLKPT